MSRSSRATCCILLFAGSAVFLSPAGAATPEWSAQWIAAEDATRPNGWWCFRKAVEVANSDVECVARIACDSKYWLWINGRLVVFEGQLKRGPTPHDTYYDEVDLTGEFREGENVVALLVWHFGKEGMSHKNSGEAGLLFEAKIGDRALRSDASWRVREHPAYGDTDDPRPNWRLPESNIAFDARRDLGDWQDPAYDDGSWPHATERGSPPTAPWNALVRRPIPLFRWGELREYENAADLPSESTGEPIVAKLPYNAQVTPYLEIEGPAGGRIDIRTDNYRGGGEPGLRAEYVTRGGRQAYESLGWMNGHEVVYAIPKGVTIHALRYRESGYDSDLVGSFCCDDEALNTLWRKAQRTLYLEMRDGFVDCPGRERAQWWGDITLELQQAFYALDRRSDRLSRKAIHELCDWQRPTGVLHAPIPSGNYDQELPMQMLASVGRHGFWEYYCHTGDRETIERVYPAVRRYLDLWELGDDDLVVQRKGDWTWGDWGTNKDLPLLYNAWYYAALDGLARMAELVGDPATVARCAEERPRLKEAFNKAYWTGASYRSPGHAGPDDDRGQALAVVVGLADEAKHADIAEVLLAERHASPYMEKYVLEALIQMGRVDDALDRMRERYAAMIDSPITTLWEGWGIGPEGYGGGSYNHAWSGGPLTLLSQYVAGVDPIEPGYARFRVEPRLGSLERVECVVPSPRGEIRVTVTRDGDRVVADVQSPPDAVAEIVLPTDGRALQDDRPQPDRP